MKSIRLVCLAMLLVGSALAQSNPVPLINNPLVPASAAPGGADFTLTQWNGLCPWFGCELEGPPIGDDLRQQFDLDGDRVGLGYRDGEHGIGNSRESAAGRRSVECKFLPYPSAFFGHKFWTL